MGPAVAAAQSPMISGVVRDSASGAGVSGAEVRVAGTPQRLRTETDGSFRIFVGSTPGRLEVRRLGFRPTTVTVREAPRASDDVLQVTLAAVPLTIAPMVVQAERVRYTGRLAGYYERLERRAQGVFITRADIDREKPAQLTDMLQRVPGIRVTRGRPGAQSIRMRGKDCRPLVWLDGAAMSAGDVDLDSFAPTTLEGIELYPGANPPGRFQAARGQSGCGTILLWSRGPDTELPRAVRGVSLDELEALIAASEVYQADAVDTAATPLDPAGWTIPYPPSMRATGTGGTVTAEFVVDTMGRVERGHVGIVSSTDPFFSAAVAEALPEGRFRPAVRRGRRVRQLVRQSFEFHPPSTRS